MQVLGKLTNFKTKVLQDLDKKEIELINDSFNNLDSNEIIASFMEKSGNKSNCLEVFIKERKCH
jgi:hypothetical protein